MIDFIDCFNRSTGWCSVHKMENMWREMHAVIDAKKTGEGIVAIELGVFGARSMIPVAHLMKERGMIGTLYGIDPWAKQEAIRGYEGENERWWSAIDLPETLKQAHILVKHYELHDHITFLTTTSDRAAVLFKDQEIDFFHCDAQHTFEQFRKDVDNYVPQVRKGCPIIVDDVGWCGGKEASKYVSQFAEYKYSIDDCGFFVKK